MYLYRRMKQQKKPRLSSVTQKKLRGFFLGLLLFIVPQFAGIYKELGGTLPDQHLKWDRKKAAEEHPPGH